MRLLIFVLIAAPAIASAQLVHGDCTEVYGQTTGNCNNGCGSCFNGNGRSSTDDVDVVLCPRGDAQGYYCDSDGGSFACMDWTFGSQRMMQQEEAFNQRV